MTYGDGWRHLWHAIVEHGEGTWCNAGVLYSMEGSAGRFEDSVTAARRICSQLERAAARSDGAAAPQASFVNLASWATILTGVFFPVFVRLVAYRCCRILLFGVFAGAVELLVDI